MRLPRAAGRELLIDFSDLPRLESGPFLLGDVLRGIGGLLHGPGDGVVKEFCEGIVFGAIIEHDHVRPPGAELLH